MEQITFKQLKKISESIDRKYPYSNYNFSENLLLKEANSLEGLKTLVSNWGILSGDNRFIFKTIIENMNNLPEKNYDIINNVIVENFINYLSHDENINDYINIINDVGNSAIQESLIPKLRRNIKQRSIIRNVNILQKKRRPSANRALGVRDPNCLDNDGTEASRKYKNRRTNNINRDRGVRDPNCPDNDGTEASRKYKNALSEYVYEYVDTIVDEYKDKLSPIKIYAITLESMKIIIEGLGGYSNPSDIMEIVTEYFLLENRVDVSPIDMYSGIVESDVYADKDKIVTENMLSYAFSYEDIINESKLTKKQRDKLSDDDFGLPKERKYPLTDENHVKSAIRFFNKCDDDKKPILARNILGAISKLDLKDIDYKESDWFTYANDKIKESGIEFDGVYSEFINRELYTESEKLQKFIAKTKDSIPVLLTKATATYKKHPKDTIDKLAKAIYAKPVDDIMHDSYSIIRLGRKFVIIGIVTLGTAGASTALIPFAIGFVTGFIDEMIDNDINRKQADKLLKEVNEEIKYVEDKKDKTTNDDKEKEYSKYIKELEDKKYKIEAYRDNLLSEKEQERLDNEEEEDSLEEIARLSIALEQFELNSGESILEVSAVKLLNDTIKRAGNKTIGKISAKDRSLSKQIDNSVEKLENKIRMSLKNDSREKVIKGQILPSMSKLIKLVVAVGATWAVAPMLAVVGSVAAIAIAKDSNAKERKMILDELDVELKIVEKKLHQAEMNNDMKAYGELLRLEKKLNLEKKRIKYKLKTGNSL